MKRWNVKDVVTRICIGVLIVFSVTVAARILTQNLVIERLHINNALTNFILSGKAEEPETTSINIDWATLYPFDTSLEKTETDQSNTGKNVSLTLPERILAPVQSLAEAYTTDNLIGYNTMIEGANAYEAHLLWNLEPMEEYNPIQKLEDGYLVSYLTPLDMSPNIQAVNDFYDFCQSRNIDFFYVQAPGKLSKYEDTDICGTLDFTDQRGDDLADGLTEHGVPVLDLRETIHEDGLSHRSLFFKTDHHWTPETGLWATEKMVDALNQLYHLDLDASVLDDANYEKKIYKKWFLGSKGKKLTLAQAEPEDITLFYPNFDTELTMQIPSLSLDKTGDFSIIYDMTQIEEKDYMDKNPYGAYHYGDCSLIQMKNERKSEGKKILLLRTSFACVVSPFLSLTTDEVEILDLRHFTGSVETYVKKSNPDVVVVLYNLESYGEVNTENHDNLFDFR